MSNNPREAKMLSLSSAEDESCMEQPRASDQGKEKTRRHDTMCGDDGHVVSRPFRGMEDDREKMMWQCQDALNGAETELCSSYTVDTRHEQNEVKGHEDAQAQESNGDAEDFMEVLDATDGMSESHMIEINQSAGNGLEASVQNDRSQANDYSLNRKLEDCDLAVQGTAPPSSVDDVVDMAADMDGSKASHFNSSSPPTLPSSVSLHPAANSNSAQLNSSSQPFDVPDIISTHETGQALPAAPSQFSCTSSESRHLVGCCADAENADCPKRDASIFTELVADVGGCLCSKNDLHDRLPKGWPDIFYPLPDLIASQRSFESQSHSSRGMTLGKTILVTGGAGYVGSHAVIEIVAAGYDVIVVDNLINASMESIRRVEKIVGKKIITYSVDLLDKPALDEVFREHNIHAVIHFAGLKAVGESCEVPLLYYKTNVGGTTNLLEVMEAHQVYNLVFSSSATVYGKPQFLPLTESHPVGGCTSPYGKTKHMVEEMLCDIATASRNWNFIILRYFNPVGAHKSGTIGEDPSGIPNNLMPFIGQVAVGRRAALKVYGNDYDTPDGTGVRDYIHVVDLAKGHVAALRKLEEGCSMKIYNLGTGRGCTVLEMVRAFEKASGKKIPYELAPRRPGDVPMLCSDPSLAERELDWKAEKGLDEMCEDLWRWQSNNPHGYNENAKK